MNTSQIKNFAIQSRNLLKAGVLNRILALGFDVDGDLTVDRPVKIQGGTIFMGQLREEGFYDAWSALEERIAKHSVKEVCEEAAYTWFNRLVAIRIMQKNDFIEPVMQYASEETRIPVIVDQARSGRLSLTMTVSEQEKLENLLRDPTKTNDQFNLLLTAFCKSNPVIYNCFGGIEKHIGLLLPDNILAQGGFIDLLNNTPYLTEDDYKQSELIGWLYQFYISEKKDEVFAKNGRYTPDEIPAATQIFTPNWIVKYMVQNTLGRIYLDNNPYSNLCNQMKYLVKIEEPTPEDAILKIDDMEGYTLIDPACGSGHILVEAFDLLYAMYQEEAYPAKAAITSILTKNIIGLDLDTRAKQLATFALLMKACQKDPSFLDCKVMPRVLDMPEPFVYRGGTMQDFLPQYFLGGSRKTIEETTKAFELLQQADSLGSIMKFDISPETRTAIERSTAEWEQHEHTNPDIEAAIPSMKVILALTDKYATTVMNPPYMGSSRFDATMTQYVEKNYREGKNDLFAVFMLTGMNLLEKKGKMGMINMQSWMFLGAFESLRHRFLRDYHLDSLLHLGPHTFDELGGEVVQNSAFVFSSFPPSGYCSTSSKGLGTYYRLVEGDTCSGKERLFLLAEELDSVVFHDVNQADFERIPGCPLGYWLTDYSIFALPSIEKSGFISGVRNKTHGNDKYVRYFWEISNTSERWKKYANAGGTRKYYGIEWYVVDWSEEARAFYDSHGGLLNPRFWDKKGITWNLISSESAGFSIKNEEFIYSSGSPTIFNKDYSFDYYLLGFLNSRVARFLLSLINPTINTTAGDVLSLPLKRMDEGISSLVASNVEISKLDWCAHETSWDFKKNELILLKERGLGTIRAGWGDTITLSMVSLPMLLAEYKAKWQTKFEQLHVNEEELNRQFINIYGLQDELKPDVPLDEITILQQGEISAENNQIVWHDDVIIKQLISYAIGCWMGRYRLDQDGLYIAHYPTDEEICAYDYDSQRFEIDDDAIIPLMGRDNPFEDDNVLQKLDNFVKIVFGEENLTENLNTIDRALGKSLEEYLVKDFWKDHKKMYQNRPIYWLFSSKKGAFQVLVYMHRMNPYTVEKIRTKYLLPYIEYLKGKIDADEARGADLTTIERKNLAKMRGALDECTEYHDQLHDIAIKAIDFDLDDGVIMNYAKFGNVLAKIK